MLKHIERYLNDQSATSSQPKHLATASSTPSKLPSLFPTTSTSTPTAVTGQCAATTIPGHRLGGRGDD